MQQRITWIDYTKSIGIYIVVLGHLPISDQISTYIYSFHMPLFFFLSGYLLKSTQTSFGDFIHKKTKTLILPYIIFSILTYAFWLLVGRHFGSDANIDIPLYKPAIGIIYASASNNYMIHNIPLWFIPCLFVVELLFYVLRKLPFSIYISLILCAAIGYTYPQVTSLRLPWGIDIAFTAVVFYGLGFICKTNNVFTLTKKVKIIGISIFILLIFIVGNSVQGRVDLNSLEFRNIFLFYATALSGIYLCYIISKQFSHNKIITKISNHTLTILALHGLSISILKACMIYILDMPIEILNQSIIWNIIIALATIIILLPCMFFFERYTPIIIGKHTLQKK